jgi:hypothetical protein
VSDWLAFFERRVLFSQEEKKGSTDLRSSEVKEADNKFFYEKTNE